MKVLWLSPWLRPLARVHADALTALGHEVLLVTSDQHPEPAEPRAGEVVVDVRWKRPWTWPEWWRLRRQVQAFRPDVVVGEIVRDPRWTRLAPGVPLVDVVHDDRPHGADEELPRWERRLFGRWKAGAVRTIVFSEHVGRHVDAAPQSIVPLASDLDKSAVPPLVPAGGRRDVVLVGRLNSYKNIPVVLEAWGRHVTGTAFRGDDLVLIGNGDLGDLPPHVRWQQGAFSYADTVGQLAAAKASVCHYRVATQSGVQVLALQLGVVPIVSDQGGLPEYQPDGAPVVGVDDVDGLAAAFDRLADPEVAAADGAAARTRYEQHHAPAVVGRALEAALSDAVGR